MTKYQNIPFQETIAFIVDDAIKHLSSFTTLEQQHIQIITKSLQRLLKMPVLRPWQVGVIVKFYEQVLQKYNQNDSPYYLLFVEMVDKIIEYTHQDSSDYVHSKYGREYYKYDMIILWMNHMKEKMFMPKHGTVIFKEQSDYQKFFELFVSNPHAYRQ
jgi:hypothetical protein